MPPLKSPPAQPQSRGHVYPSPEAPRAAAQSDSVATDVPALVADFNALLAKLRAAGLLAE